MKDTAELANGYTTLNSTQQSAGKFLLSKLEIVPGLSVLDVGCGPGDITTTIADMVGGTGKVIGIDPSEERISIAQRSLQDRSTNNKNNNLSFFQGRAEDLSRFADSSFDVVYVNSTFHWVEDQGKAVKEFHRVLKAGGRLGVSGGSGDFVAEHEKIKARVLSREPFSGYPDSGGPKFVKRSEMGELLKAAGFSRWDMVVNQIVKSAPDGEAMINWLDTSSSGKTYGGIPLKLRSKAKEEMKKEWAKLTTEDGINMPMELLVTVAWKE